MPKGNYGSKKKLNWHEPEYNEKTVKSVPHSERVDQLRRFGTPPTRRGAYNGHSPGLSPSTPSEVTPSLYVNKAVLQPVKYGPGGKKEFERKRDPSGRFAPSQQAGEQSTAEEDSTDEQRQVRLREARARDSIRQAKQQAARAARGQKTKPAEATVGGGRKPTTKHTAQTKKAMPSLPGSQQADSFNSANDAPSNAIGATNSGLPVFDDPYNSQHENYTPADHAEAADLNNQLAQQAQQSGDQMSAQKYQNNAAVHQEMAGENQAPGDRFLDNLMGQDPGQPGSAMGPSTDSGMMSGQDPGMVPDQQAGMDPGMGQTDPMQQQQAGMQQPGYDQFANPMGAIPNNFSADDLQNFVAPGGQEPIQDFTDPNQAPPMNADMNKPLAPGPQSGPKPGMVSTDTGDPVGPQTAEGQDMGQNAAAGGDPLMDMMDQGGDASMEPGMEGDDEPYMEDMMDQEGFNPVTMEVEDGGDGFGDDGGGDTGGELGDGMEGEEAPNEDIEGGEDNEDVAVPESNAGAPGPPSEPDREGEDDDKEEEFEDAEKALSRAIDVLRRYG